MRLLKGLSGGIPKAVGRKHGESNQENSPEVNHKIKLNKIRQTIRVICG
jgi:hypothetical protein